MRKSVPMSCRALVDFDGTIAPDDPTDRLFESCADPLWRDIEEAWQKGKITSRECMERQVALIRASPNDLDRLIDTIHIDPAFPDFLRFCQGEGIDVTIVSDGFEYIVRRVLEREQLAVPFFANDLKWMGDNRWQLSFPHQKTNCRVGGGNCKCSHGAQQGNGYCVVIGDGRSDFCMASQADYVIAKGHLLAFCKDALLPHAPFQNFENATAGLAAWLTRRFPGVH